MAFEEF